MSQGQPRFAAGILHKDQPHTEIFNLIRMSKDGRDLVVLNPLRLLPKAALSDLILFLQTPGMIISNHILAADFVLLECIHSKNFHNPCYKAGFHRTHVHRGNMSSQVGNKLAKLLTSTGFS